MGGAVGFTWVMGLGGVGAWTKMLALGLWKGPERLGGGPAWIWGWLNEGA